MNLLKIHSISYELFVTMQMVSKGILKKFTFKQRGTLSSSRRAGHGRCGLAEEGAWVDGVPRESWARRKTGGGKVLSPLVGAGRAATGATWVVGVQRVKLEGSFQSYTSHFYLTSCLKNNWVRN